MEIVFLGTGGGRFNLISQVRRTGGFLLKGSLQMHVDPGPGALVACKAFSQDATKTGVVVVTHNHIDHLNDAALMLEAINCFPGRKKGELVASKSILAGDEYGEKGISSYFLEKLSSARVAVPGKPLALGSGRKAAALLPTPVKHEDGTGFGFVLEMDGARVGYTSDTEYFPALSRHFSGCDALIANNLKPSRDAIGGHLFTSDTARLLSGCSKPPKLCVITHLGMSLLKAGPEKEAEKIEKASGVRTIAAEDGMEIAV
ncbi:MAG: MBL fold metallo-hydrolase [Candidatus Micrarchaeia archaeon]|jgi:phosphoribosyl 1,2-cyclic phosphodiesterase